MVLLSPFPLLPVIRGSLVGSYAASLLLAAGAAFVFALPAQAQSSSSSSSSAPGVQIFVTDGRNTVKQGGTLIYVVELLAPSGNVETDVTLELPTQADTISPDNGGRIIGKLVKWDRVSLQQNQTTRFTVQANLVTVIAEGTVLRAIARAAGNASEDETTVRSTVVPPSSVFEVLVTDERTSASPGQKLQYTAVVRNISTSTQTTDVSLEMPLSVEVTTIDPLVSTDTSTITWSGMRFEPGQVRTFTVGATVQRSVTDFVSMQARLTAGGASTVDTTVVRRSGANVSSAASRSRSSSSSSSSRRTAARNVLFTKTANASEVLPGGTIRYTLRVQNVLLTVIDDAVVTDRFDPALLSVADRGGATLTAPGQLRWTLPRLQPGNTWQTTYVLAVSETMPAGTVLSNIASIAGADVSTATLNEKVSVVRTDIVEDMPNAGASFDALFLLVSACASLVAAAGARKARR